MNTWPTGAGGGSPARAPEECDYTLFRGVMSELSPYYSRAPIYFTRFPSICIDLVRGSRSAMVRKFGPGSPLEIFRLPHLAQPTGTVMVRHRFGLGLSAPCPRGNFLASFSFLPRFACVAVPLPRRFRQPGTHQATGQRSLRK